MKYQKTKLVDFDSIISRTVSSNEVPQVCPHKPLNNQGRFVNKACPICGDILETSACENDGLGNCLHCNGRPKPDYKLDVVSTHKIKETELVEEASPVTGSDGLPFPQTFDASAWATEFIRTIKKDPSIPMDKDTMISWFANAIMRGFDTAKQRDIEKDNLCDTKFKARGSVSKRVAWSEEEDDYIKMEYARANGKLTPYKTMATYLNETFHSNLKIRSASSVCRREGVVVFGKSTYRKKFSGYISDNFNGDKTI